MIVIDVLRQGGSWSGRTWCVMAVVEMHGLEWLGMARSGSLGWLRFGRERRG